MGDHEIEIMDSPITNTYYNQRSVILEKFVLQFKKEVLRDMNLSGILNINKETKFHRFLPSAKAIYCAH